LGNTSATSSGSSGSGGFTSGSASGTKSTKGNAASDTTSKPKPCAYGRGNRRCRRKSFALFAWHAQCGHKRGRCAKRKSGRKLLRRSKTASEERALASELLHAFDTSLLASDLKLGGLRPERFLLRGWAKVSTVSKCLKGINIVGAYRYAILVVYEVLWVFERKSLKVRGVLKISSV
jgi:hypothetical protein